MKTIRLFFIIAIHIGLFSLAKAQTEGVSINTDGSNPDASAMLDIQSTTKGMLVPRMTTAQRTSINGGNPATGLLVFDITTSGFWFYNGTAWQDLSVSAATPDKITDTDNNTKIQVEKSSNENVIRFDVDGTERMDLNGIRLFVNTSNGLYLPGAFGPDNAFVGSAGNAISFGHASVSEDFIGYANNTFYFKDSPGGGDGNDPNIVTNGTISAGVFSGDGSALTGITVTQVGDADSDTKIQVEEGTDEDTIRFDVAGTEFAKMDGRTFQISGPGESLAIGVNAGINDDGQSRGNVFIGRKSGEFTTTGTNNTGLGNYSLSLNIAGNQNTALGREAMVVNSSGNDNTASGFVALRQNDTGNNNSAFGAKALVLNQSGNNNTAQGFDALFNNLTGSSNTAIGTNGLRVNTVGSRNTALGYNANVSANNLTNATAIGANTIVGQDSSLILGDAANVGIGTSVPDAKLHVVGNIKMVDGNQAEGKVLVSDANGVASWQVPINEIPDPTLAVPIRYHGSELFIHPTDNATAIDWATAQSTCANLTAFGFSDWYLPSRLELDAMHKQSYLITGLEQTEAAKYWSNTELDASNAYAQRLDFGGPDPDAKTDTAGHNCRCIRKNP